jgi:tetratricopeptide (TPR) repeat protein
MIKSDYFRFDKKDILFFLIILSLSMTVRIFYISDYRHTDAYLPLPSSDSYHYFLWGKDIAGGESWGSKAFMKWPLYAYFLGFLFRFFGENIYLVYWLQFTLGTLSCILVYMIGRIIFNRAVGLLAALFCLGYGIFLFYDGLLIYTTLSIFLNLFLFLFFLYVQNSPSKTNLFLLGIFLGICTLTQSNVIIFGFLGVFWIFWQNRPNLPKLALSFFSFLLGLFLIIGAVTLRNYLVEKDFILISGHLGVNFYIGNNPEAGGLFFTPTDLTPAQEGMFRDAKVIAQATRGREMKASEVSKFWFNKSLEFIKENPSAFLRLMGKKIFFLFSPKEQNHDAEYFLVFDKIRIFRFLFLDLSLIMPLFVLGLLINLRRFKNSAFLYLVLFSFSLSIVMFFVTTRYRVSMVPFMSIFAASAVFSGWEALTLKKHFRFFKLSISFIAIFLFFQYSSFAGKIFLRNADNVSQYFHYFYKGMAHSRSADYASAIEELKKAYELYPSRRDAVVALGNIYYNREELKLAEAYFKKAILISPYYVDGYYNLGVLYNRKGLFRESRDILEKAIKLDREDVGCHYELGKSYKGLGDRLKAKQEFSLALAGLKRWQEKEKMIIKKELTDLDK